MSTLQEQASALRAQIAEITAQLAPIQSQLNELRAQEKTAGLARIEEVTVQIRAELDEIEGIANNLGLPFYRETYIQGIDSGRTWDGEPYWQQSDYC